MLLRFLRPYVREQVRTENSNVSWLNGIIFNNHVLLGLTNDGGVFGTFLHIAYSPGLSTIRV